MESVSIHDLDQNYVILNTKVTVGKSYKSRGWALSREDIHDWIPTEKFEKDCKVIINNISADAIIRFNPRLFYESDKLSSYLEELYKNGCYNHKIPMKIKINKNNLFSNIESIEKYLDVEDIDTQLLVGKSYKSKGWQLSKDVTSLLFPSEYYDDEYIIYINEIESNAKLNFQFRLFYKSDELSKYLEELHYKIPREKIPAKIVFEENSSSNENEDKNQNILIEEDDSESDDFYSCDICGKQYVDDSKLLIETINFLHCCPDCAEKIYILEKYHIIKNSSFSKFIKRESAEELFKSNFNQIWDLLIKYNFLTPFGELFKLNDNTIIEKDYSKFLGNEISEQTTKSKIRNRSKILEFITEEDETEKDRCDICGNILKNTEIEKCESCNDKSLATEYLQNIVTLVPYGKNFTKVNLINVGIDGLDIDLLIDKLTKYDLIIQSDIFYKLNNVDYLNDFIQKYSESPYELRVNYIGDNSNILKISKEDLSSEDRIDALVKWKKYGDFISFKKGQYGFVSVQYKQDGRFMYSKGYGTSYEAKVDAIYYLKSLGKIMLIVDEDIKLEFK